ncbi:MAG TPA: helix-hairpin-helix domain-containing protein [Actinotalea sp.]|nr:helix-hairpin-helix domain-containing protein [Actinotalea sp.]
MRHHKAVWILLAALAASLVWAWRLLRDDGEWTPAPAPTRPPAPAAVVPEPEPERAAAPAAEPAPEPAAAPAAEPEPEPAAAPTPDALSRIEGIGPKIAGALTAAGLGTFAAVADASEDDLRAALSAAGLRFAPSLPTWARQARLLADGDEEGFGELTRRLVGGREQ